MVRITPLRFLKRLLNDRLRRMFDAGPDSLVFRSRAWRQGIVKWSQLTHNLFGRADKWLNGVNGHCAHSFGLGLLARTATMFQTWKTIFGGLPSRFPEIGLAHRDAFAIHGDGENRAGLLHLACVLRALLFVKRFEIATRASSRFLNLAFGNRHSRLIADGDQRLVIGFFGRRTGDLTLQSMRITFRR